MALSNEDALAIATLVKEGIDSELTPVVEEIQTVMKNVDVTLQAFQAFVVERTSGIENDEVAGVMMGRVNEFWDRAIAANYAATKIKETDDE